MLTDAPLDAQDLVGPTFEGSVPPSSFPLRYTSLNETLVHPASPRRSIIMAGPQITKAGTAPIKKVGHTVGTKYGTNPLAKERGASNPSEITYGGSGK